MENMTGSQCEPGHHLAWIAPQVAAESLYLENQKEAVRIYLRKLT
jgi:hypothetical protein